MLVVGLTGGISCGKSTVSAELARQGFPVLDADALAKEVSQQGRWGFRRVLAAFGPGILLPNGDIDREALGRLVFGDAAARRRLNAATHLPVAVLLFRRLLACWLRCCPVVVLDMPLLFETGAGRLVSTTLVVTCSPSVQLQRLMLRDGSSPADAQVRIGAQMPLAAKEQLADRVITNDGSRQELLQQVQDVVQQLRRQGRSWRHRVSSPVGLAAAVAVLAVALRLRTGSTRAAVPQH